MSARINDEMIDLYVSVAGDPERLPGKGAEQPDWWTIMDELLFDLHLIRHGYANDGYERHIERRLSEVCADDRVAQRIRDLRL